MPQAIHISPIDNVVVALHPIAKGTLVEVDGLAVTALEDIPQGHKMAVKPIKNGENVIKYGFPIGHATADAAPGTWMHTHNVHTNLSGEVEYSYNPAPDLAPLPKVEPETFMGFRRKDGRAAIRNEIWIIPTVGCVNDIAKKMVADNQDLVTGSIEGLYTFTHPFGCSQTGHDHAARSVRGGAGRVRPRPRQVPDLSGRGGRVCCRPRYPEGAGCLRRAV